MTGRFYGLLIFVLPKVSPALTVTVVFVFSPWRLRNLTVVVKGCSCRLVWGGGHSSFSEFY